MKLLSRLAQCIGAIVLVLGTVGCTTTASIDATKKTVVDSRQRVENITAKIEGQKLVDVPLYLRVPGLWISDRVLPRSTAQRLPAVFNKQYVLREQNPLTISDVADIIRSSTGLNVMLHGDAIGSQRSPVDSVSSLAALLDSSTSRFGMTWQWLDGSIQIQQSVVRTFVIDRPGIEAVSATTLGSPKVVAKDAWADILDAIRVVAPHARVSAMRTSNTITVADSPANVARVAELLEIDDRQAGKRTTLLWKLVNYTATTGGGAGLGISSLLNRSNRTFSFSSPTSLAGMNDGIIKVSPLSTGTSGANILAGTNLILNLLNESGSAVVVRDGISELKQNGRSDFGTEKEVFYISKSTPGISSSTTASASVGLEQASVKVGLAGAFGATIYDSERMDLSYDFTVSTLDQLKSVSSAGTTLQSPETTKRFARGLVAIKHGETWILSAETSDTSTFDRRGLLPGSAAVLGGSESTGTTRDQWLLIVTPILSSKGI